MTPEDQAGGMPPGLMDALMGGGEEAEPDEIDVGGEEEESDEDLIRTAIEALEKAQSNESDDADSAKIAAVVKALYELTSGQQDAQITAMGGKPKEMRGLNKLYGSAAGPASGYGGPGSGGGPGAPAGVGGSGPGQQG